MLLLTEEKKLKKLEGKFVKQERGNDEYQQEKTNTNRRSCLKGICATRETRLSSAASLTEEFQMQTLNTHYL